MNTSTTTNTHVVAPWGYDLLPSQRDVRAQWKSQIFSSIVVGGYYWDTIISLPRDFQFIFQRKFNYATVLFIVNRVCCITTLTNFWLFAVYTGSQCLPVYKIAGILEPVTIFTSQALLLIRVRVLYQNNWYLLTFMVLFLFVGPLIDLIEAFRTTGFNLPGNVGCMFGPSSPYIYLVFLFQALFDCLCFILCMYKLFRVGQGGGFMRIGKEMVNGGLVYYIPNVVIQIATIILTQQKGIEDQFILPPAADGIASAQALRITRNLWWSGQKQKYRLEDPMSLTAIGSKEGSFPGEDRKVEDYRAFMSGHNNLCRVEIA
ncbi:hypothetical protein COCC4DRAFT_167016 [Bipolaris maydis ATCC 48331]|uniref:DUF6533 domain-containing protein n=2 Tax=Cochliobolus heterostrophus TaxID=5016 RepID=M2SMH9_COCH5|nr:uncharacterized protein COCC4DRAFT_167016 [Bipolaris maydis ATCC 48331]EMD86540.1 hypothetical protein COCHEDRAFT_1198415 [Bipolaris maydis C5]KAJ5029814.1 hypothetical protein J3E73DRAFT_22504 [Bipolaris maydis]ENI06488.1 hypothetical protein COCC4DRAFT_167016 [Bipolaris maydis ATCC 48331]KAJ5038513.1 hypothetical protein J3E74DRAFT_423572 [Bipolaris maydis]KAJ5064821.1 hypothetical protein J3E74DRAFT_413918 [Bipolaris maydis]